MSSSRVIGLGLQGGARDKVRKITSKRVVGPTEMMPKRILKAAWGRRFGEKQCPSLDSAVLSGLGLKEEVRVLYSKCRTSSSTVYTPKT